MLAYVEALVTTHVLSFTRFLIRGIGRGVVVITPRGSRPNRKPRRSWSQLSIKRHDATSSAQKPSCCGPRKRSGSSAENVVQIAPFGHVNLRFEGSYVGLFHGGQTAKIPAGPSTTVSLTSPAVAATSAMRLRRPDSISPRTHSAPALVFPEPRPAIRSQNVHCLFGGN